MGGFNGTESTRFKYPTDDQLLICLLFQRRHSGLYSFDSFIERVIGKLVQL